jgi:hypothetical protein
MPPTPGGKLINLCVALLPLVIYFLLLPNGANVNDPFTTLAQQYDVHLQPDVSLPTASYAANYHASTPKNTRVSQSAGLWIAPDTTAVILNWSRLPNVILLVALLCSTPLEGIIARVLIWNNRPDVKLTYNVRLTPLSLLL